ncbi:MAG TPA: hypothetical protein VGM72_11790 [Micropepsaceae bacterium]|jgi:hypothetical protein
MIQNRRMRRMEVRERASATIMRRPSLPRAAFVFLALAALAIQLFVVQTHIHIPQAQGRSESVSIVTLAKTLIAGPQDQGAGQQANLPRDKYPINEDPSNCPLCQELVHSGQFVQSVAVLSHISFWVSVHFIPLSEALPRLFIVSHSWQGRAPPQH